MLRRASLRRPYGRTAWTTFPPSSSDCLVPRYPRRESQLKTVCDELWTSVSSCSESVASFKVKMEAQAAAKKLEADMSREPAALVCILKGDQPGNTRWLYAGSRAAAYNKEELLACNVGAILNLAALECENFHEGDPAFTYLGVPVENTAEFPLVPILPQCLEFIGTRSAASPHAVSH